jgi:hypothetical protein
MIIGIITFSSIVLHYLYQVSQEKHPLQAFFSFETVHELV